MFIIINVQSNRKDVSLLEDVEKINYCNQYMLEFLIICILWLQFKNGLSKLFLIESSLGI